MTPILFFVCLSHTPPLNSSQEPLTTKAKRSYLKVAQEGTADSRGRKGGGTGRAQQAWPLPEASKGASGKRRGTYGLVQVVWIVLYPILGPHSLPLSRAPY